KEVADTFEKFDASPPSVYLPLPNLVSKAIAFAILFSISSLVVSRYVARTRKNTLFLWTMIGMVAICVWNLIALAFVFLGYLITGRSDELNRFTSFKEFYLGPSSIIIVLCFNILYGCILKLISALVIKTRSP